MNGLKQAAPLTKAEQWIKSIDIWDPKWDFVMHDSHWLTSEWTAACEKCLVTGSQRNNFCEPIKNVTNNTITTSNNTITTSVAAPTTTATVATTVPKTNGQTKIVFTSPDSPPLPKFQPQQPVQQQPMQPQQPQSQHQPLHQLSKHPEPELQPEPKRESADQQGLLQQQQALPEMIIPMTPIAPPLLSKNRALFSSTPHTTTMTANHNTATKYHHDTFTRSTRASTKKAAAASNNEHDLINLNETFDLYKSALAETPPEATGPVEPRDSNPITSRIPRRGIK